MTQSSPTTQDRAELIARIRAYADAAYAAGHDPNHLDSVSWQKLDRLAEGLYELAVALESASDADVSVARTVLARLDQMMTP